MTERTCIDCGLAKPTRFISRGLCSTCYRRRKRSGTLPPLPKPAQPKSCSVDECDSQAKTRGMCGKHAERVRKYGDPSHPVRIVNDPERRFWAKVDKRGPGECWPWLGVHVEDGYGQFSIGREVRVSPHRFSYELNIGPIPDGAQIDHVKARGCTRRDCVNPRHLEAVTPYENLMRSDGITAHNKRKRLCIRGHKFDIVETQSNGRRRRVCSTCRRERGRRANERRATARRAA